MRIHMRWMRSRTGRDGSSERQLVNREKSTRLKEKTEQQRAAGGVKLPPLPPNRAKGRQRGQGTRRKGRIAWYIQIFLSLFICCMWTGLKAIPGYNTKYTMSVRITILQGFESPLSGEEVGGKKRTQENKETLGDKNSSNKTVCCIFVR